MFLFEAKLKGKNREGRPEGKFRQEFYRKANPPPRFILIKILFFFREGRPEGKFRQQFDVGRIPGMEPRKLLCMVSGFHTSTAAVRGSFH